MPYKDKNKELKRQRIKNWKLKGLIGDYEMIYERYINTTNCDLCNIELCEGRKGNNKKVMDHCHITGNFRNILCNTCNTNMLDQSIRTTNKSGIKNIYYSKKNDSWRYQKIHYGKNISKCFKNKIDAICYKYIHILELRILRKKKLN